MIKKIFIIIMFILCTIPVFAENEININIEPTGIVQKADYVDINSEVAQTKQIVTIKLLSGENKGNIIEVENILTGNPYYDINLKPNMKVLLHEEITDNGIEYSVSDIKRSGTLFWLAAIFCGLLMYVGKSKGIYSLTSIALTVFIIANCMSPLILHGINPIAVTIVTCIISTAITMYLVGGFNAKSTSALIGTIMSLAFAGVISGITMLTAHLTGFTGEYTLFLYSSHPELNFIDITISAMILATLGAVMDVAMSISSTINEIFITDNTKTMQDLFKSGMNVGKDIIGTMANTLILVYLGGSLPLLLLLGNVDLQKFLNLNQVVTEITSALIGSIAIVVCVPFTALTASALIHKYLTHNIKNQDIQL